MGVKEKFRIVTRIENLPDLTGLEAERQSDLVEDPTFIAIKERVRKEAITVLAQGDQALIDSAQIAYSHSFERYVIPEEIVARLGLAYGLRHPQARMQIQPPGLMTSMHLDDLSIGYVYPYEPSLPRLPFSQRDKEAFDKDPTVAVRFLIPIDPYRPGQGILFEDQLVANWQPGDSIFWDWQHTPHATFNTSYWKRRLIRLTGLRTLKTKEILAGQHPVVFY